MKVASMSDGKVLVTDGNRTKSVLVIGDAAGGKLEKLNKATRRLTGKVNKRYGKRI